MASPPPTNRSRGWKKAWPRIPDPANRTPRRFSPTHHPHPAEHKMSEATTADEQLRLFIERIERLEEEKKGIGDDIRDVYNEAKSQGYEPKLMRQIVRPRKLPINDRKEMEANLDV